MKSDHHQGVSAGTYNAFATRMSGWVRGRRIFQGSVPTKRLLHRSSTNGAWHGTDGISSNPRGYKGVGFDGGRMKGVQHNLTLSCFFSGNEFHVAR